jgi:hypothetical protein
MYICIYTYIYSKIAYIGLYIYIHMDGSLVAGCFFSHAELMFWDPIPGFLTEMQI